MIGSFPGSPEQFPGIPVTFSPIFSACQNCNPFPTNVKRRKSSDLQVQEMLISYGMNADGCKFAVLQCRNPVAKDILMEWYDPFGESLGTTGSIKHIQHAIGLVTCNQNSEWTYTENDKTKIVHSATCEYLN
ncbi:unnamed protein product [Onchocerca ochengi]|nr:unnamed protein product [Onchocerca ochengi]